MTNNHVSKWDHCFVCCCYFGLLWLFLRNHFWAPLYQIQPFFHIYFEVMTAAAYFFHVGRDVSTQTTICDCTCQRTANYQKLAVAAVVSCSLQSCYLELHFKHACTHVHTFWPWKLLTSFKTTMLGNHSYFLVAWNSTVLKFGQHSPLLYQ